MKKRIKIFIKPHHFLDIIKLYGLGIKKFKPDPKYHHDFYKIGNLLLKNPQTVICLITKADDICKPCKFRKGFWCIDTLKNFKYKAKEKWNRIIDKRIFKILRLKEKDKLTALEFCQLVRQKLTPNIIFQIWQERPKIETKKRVKYLLKGFKNLL